MLITVTGQRLAVAYHGRTTPEELLSVRGYTHEGIFKALQVRQIDSLGISSFTVHGILMSSTADFIRTRSGGSTYTAFLLPSTRISAGAGSASESSFRSGQTVSLRFWTVGRSNYAASIHIYATSAVRGTRAEIRGSVTHIDASGLVVKGPLGLRSVKFGPGTSIRRGAAAASAQDIRVGQDVLIHFSCLAGVCTASSIHIYVRPAAIGRRGDLRGRVTHVNRLGMTIQGSFGVKSLKFTNSTSVRKGARVAGVHDIRVGQEVLAYFSCLAGACGTTSVHIYVRVPQAKPAAATTIVGTLLSTRNRTVVVQQAGNTREIHLTSGTRVYVRKVLVLPAWLFPGPAVTVTVVQRAHGRLDAVSVDFRPPAAGFSGDVVSAEAAHVVAVSQSVRREVDLRAASILVDGRPAAAASVTVGSHIRVTGFLLPSGTEAAMAVDVSHPQIKVTGTVETITSGVITVRSASGAYLLVRLKPGVTAWSSKTAQRFRVEAIPVLSHLSGVGTNVSGHIVLTSAVIVLQKETIRGTVAAVSTTSVSVLALGRTVKVWVGALTDVSLGTTPIGLSSIESGDVISCSGYADARGGMSGTTVDIHRSVISRSGTIALLSETGFDLILKDGSLLHVLVGSETTITQLGRQISQQELRNNLQVSVQGSLRPASFAVDATLIQVL